ncbi:MAG: DUF2141 domain-containing protein [Bacteroidales bacterium]
MRSSILCIFVFISSVLYAQNYTLTVKITNIKSTEGTMMVGLYTADGFMNKPYKGLKASPQKGSIRCVFTDVPSGKYAVALFQDANNNRKQERNFIGIPTESWGLSTNPTILRQPVFKDASFDLKSNQTIEVKLKH